MDAPDHLLTVGAEEGEGEAGDLGAVRWSVELALPGEGGGVGEQRQPPTAPGPGRVRGGLGAHQSLMSEPLAGTTRTKDVLSTQGRRAFLTAASLPQVHPREPLLLPPSRPGARAWGS